MIYLVNGTGVNAAVRPVDAPAPTVHFGARLNTVRFADETDPVVARWLAREARI